MRYLYIVVFVLVATAVIALQRLSFITEAQTNNFIAAMLPLLGVFLTLDWSKRQFERNLREEREKAADTRRFSAKREAFSDAAQAVLNYIEYFQTLPDRQLPSDGVTPEEIRTVGSALIKLHFYAEMETIQSSILLSKLLSEATSEAMKPRLTAGLLQGLISGKEIEIAGLESINRRLDSEVLALMGSDPNHAMIVATKRQSAEIYSKIAALHGERVTLLARKFAATEACRDVVISKLDAIYQKSNELLVLARRELGFPLEEDIYRKFMDDQSAAALHHLRSLIQTVRTQVGTFRP